MPSAEGPNDDCGRLVEQCLDGDEDAQHELIERYAGLCTSIVSRVLGDVGQSYVEDGVQETFYAVFARLSQWRGENLSAWIGTIAARRASDIRRRLGRTHIEKTGLDAAVRSVPSTELGNTELAALVEAIDKARNRSTERQQRVLDLLLAGESRREISRQLCISLRTLHYDLRTIRRNIEKGLGIVADR